MYTEKIKELSKKYYEYIVSLRHEFHQYPELAFKEFKTSKNISKELKDMGIEVIDNIANTGVVGLIKGKYPGKTVLLRADMDALPIEEEVDVSYKSKIPGCMHACGHDGHSAGLLGVAMVLNELKEDLHGNIKLVFQPAEEGDGGAAPMIKEGILENPKVDGAFSCHLWGEVPEGYVKIKYGSMMASSDDFVFKVIGKGGHAAMPHLSIDPIIIAVQAINNMQSIISRNISPMESAVVSFCSIHGGNSFNSIPNEVEVKGTIRTLNNSLRKWIPETMEKILKSVAESQGATYEFRYNKFAPPVVNDDKMTDLVATSVSKIVGEKKVIQSKEANMGAEDFACFTEKVPSCFFFVGIAPDKDNLISHHHPKFRWEDKNLLILVQCMAKVAVDFLNSN